MAKIYIRNSRMEKKDMKNTRVLYPELIRTIAIIAVIIQHVTSRTLVESKFFERNWQIAQIMHVMVQWCVPLFLMVSGIFLLDPKREITIKKLYTSYIWRMLQAIIVMVPLHFFVNEIICKGKSITDPHFQRDLVYSLVCSSGSPVYWYLYMMIGLYVYLPIMRLIVKNASKSQLMYFLIVVFLGTCVFKYIQYFEADIFKPIVHFVKKLKMGNMVKYGYFLFLGYFLSKYEITKKPKICIYVVAIIGMMMSVYMARTKSIQAGEYIEKWSSDHSPLQYIAVMAIFILVKEIAERIRNDGACAKLIYVCGECSFGVYLIHNMFINILKSIGFGGFVGNAIITIPLTVLIVYFISMIIVMMLKKVPWIKSWI